MNTLHTVTIKPYLMKRALITLIVPVLTFAGALPLIFTTKPNRQKNLTGRYWMADKLTLLYTENTVKDLKKNTSYILSFQAEHKRLADTIKLENTTTDRYVYNGRLFVLPSFKADNEDDRSFRNNNVIDVYQVDDNSYEGSFYMPGIRNKKITAIRIVDGFLIAFCQNSFSIYALPLENMSGIVFGKWSKSGVFV